MSRNSCGGDYAGYRPCWSGTTVSTSTAVVPVLPRWIAKGHVVPTFLASVAILSCTTLSIVTI